MTTQEQALVRLAQLLSEHGIPYMVIGGLANAVWGEPRTTLDIDVTVSSQSCASFSMTWPRRSLLS
jgi:hypothetical protein